MYSFTFRLLLTYAIINGFVYNSFAQASIGNYTTARTTGNTYNSISVTGSAFSSWRNTGSLQEDDNRSSATDIGFDFWYNGVRYTQFSVSTNGFIDFSSSDDDGGPAADDYGYDNTAFSNFNVNGGTYLAIAPFYDDLIAQGGAGALGNSIKYLVSGSAPSRALTIEWIDMARSGNSTPSLNFQVKIYETSGIIEVNYSTMTQGTAGFSYTMGINGPVISNPPTALQMKVLQTVNSNSFSNAIKNNLATMPLSGSRYTFTPPTPTAAAGILTFSAVTSTSITLNWPNWASNERGYVIYNSIDGVNYTFVLQTAANATSSAVTALTPGTTYYWKLYAVTEGRLSASLNGTRATLSGGNVISVATGNWNAGSTWDTGVVPTAGDNVTIADGHTVSINTNAFCNNLTVGQGAAATLEYSTNVSRTLTVYSDLLVNTSATFWVNTGSNGTHFLIAKGNITNNGTINFLSDVNSFVDVSFQKDGNQTLSGTGATTVFKNIVLNMGNSLNNTLDITLPSFSALPDFLTLTAGTFKISTSGATNITPFSVATTIPQKAGIHLNSAASTINFGAGVTMYGNITVSNGTMNIGDGVDEDLTTSGGAVSVSGGTLNIAGKHCAAGVNNTSNFTLSGGTVVVPVYGSGSTTTAPFQITGAGSVFNMSGGTLIIAKEGGSGGQDYGFINTGSSGGSVTGGILQIGDASTPAGSTMRVNTTFPVGGLLVNSANATATLFTNPLNVITDVTIASGILNANNLNMSLGGNWTNNGGTFIPGTATVTFSGTGAQAITGTVATQTFNNVIINKTVGTTLSATGSTTNIFVTGNWTNNDGTFVPGIGTITFSGTGAQAIDGTAASQTFYDVVVAKTAGTLLSVGGSTTTLTTNNLTLTTGDFTAPANLNVTASATASVLLSSGTFIAGTETYLNGNWTNNGATFTPGTGTITFSGTLGQTIFKTGGETFNNMVFSNAGTKTLNSAVTANGNFTINSGSTFDVNITNNQVTIIGNFSNSGILTARNGNIFLNGTTAQTIGGTSITDFYDLTLNNAAGASLQLDERIIGSLVLNGGTFNVNGMNLTLVSTATGSGRIAQITGTGDISGNVIVQRYVPGGYTGWAYLGAPITSALTFADWDDDIPISCGSCPDGSAAGFLSIYSYDETVGGVYDSSLSYIPLSTINDPIENGIGYWVYFGDGYYTTNDITMDVTGTVRKFNYTIPLNYTISGGATEDGWNLISNPYPSPISWTALKGATTGIDNAIYVYNADLNGGLGAHAAYVNGISSPAVGSGGIGNTIPICQGFYVHSTGATSLNAMESNKISGNPTFLRQNPYNKNETTSAEPPLIRLYLDGLNLYHDETVLYLQDGATHGFDPEYDSYKLVGADVWAPAIALEKDTNLFQINGVNPITANFSMPLKTTTGYAGNYTISADNIGSFPPGACINLYDVFTGVTTDLRNSSYTFFLDDTLTTARFVLNITIDPLQINTSTSDPDCNQPNTGQIVAIGTNGGPWNYYWKDSNGLPLKTSLSKSTADTLDTLVSGTYLLDMNTVGSCDNNFTQFTINSMDVASASFTCPDTVYLGPGGNIDFTNTSVNGSTNNWDFGDNSGFSTIASPTYTYLNPGTYTVTLITESSTGCTDSVSKTIVVVNDVVGIKDNTAEGILSIKTLTDSEYLVQQKLNGPQTVNINLYDALGKEMIGLGTHKTSYIQLNVDLSAYASGMYYLKIHKEDKTEVIKLIKN